ncbi:MAG TPA: Ig-like domain-containing protein, partial [Terriglobales bacterium]|nr:Ig-like domain-containing protein [Terriglobales bacterium]
MARRFASCGFFLSCILLPLITVLLSATMALGDTEVALTSDHPSNHSAIGETVVFTATVTDKTDPPGVPTGYVKFKQGDLVLARAQLHSGAATFATAVLNAGSHEITALYEGEGSFPSSFTATALTHVVDAASRAVLVEVVL